MNKISVYIIAFNEADKIRDAINSVLWADEIIVADSNSQDNTAALAEELGAKVVQIPFKSFGDLRNRAMAACTHDWIFSLDADERCTPEARDEILACLNNPQADAYYVPRKNYFMGRWIRYSGFYPDYRQPQLFKKGTLVFREDDPVHEEFTINTQRPVGYFRHAIWQMPFKRLDELMHKANKYSTLGADKLVLNNRRPCSVWTALTHGLWSFFHTYFLKRGILDGWPGFIIALYNFESTFYKYAKFYELHIKATPPASPPLKRVS
ncbi:MAG: glycosyltransferase family 2 protein [Desulfobulbus oligotrophicus]|jgi:glycosyltransferase involved in cell wall biosynthesis|nr:glycosyltransferase family 2 protein [Desulfobulbus oligotrophicus]